MICQPLWWGSRAFLILAALSTPAWAQNPLSVMQLVSCRTIRDDVARLKCFDEAMAALLAPAKPAVTDTPGAVPPPFPEAKRQPSWRVRERKAPIDDSPNVEGILESSDGAAELILRCEEKRTEVVVYFKNQYLSSSDAKTLKITYRLGEQAAVTTQWRTAQQGVAVFAPNGPAFLRAMPATGKIFFRVFDGRGREHDALFDQPDLSALRSKIVSYCTSK